MNDIIQELLSLLICKNGFSWTENQWTKPKILRGWITRTGGLDHKIMHHKVKRMCEGYTEPIYQHYGNSHHIVKKDLVQCIG